MRSRSWGARAAPFALEYRGNTTGKEAFNSEGLLDKKSEASADAGGSKHGRSTEWDYDALIGCEKLFMGKIETARDSPNYGAIGETNGVFEAMSLVLKIPSKNISRTFVYGIICTFGGDAESDIDLVDCRVCDIGGRTFFECPRSEDRSADR